MSISVGGIVEGKITGITKFGTFIECEDGTKGLVHISQISNDYIERIEDVLRANGVAKYKVMSTENNKISFSIGECLPKEEHKKEFPEKTFSDEDKNSNRESSPESMFDDLFSKFMKENNERLDSTRQREDKKFPKKGKHN